jgi:hypothetical protein
MTDRIPEEERLPVDLEDEESYAPLFDEGFHDPDLWEDEGE